MLPENLSKLMSEKTRKRRNKISNKQNNKRRVKMSIREVENKDLGSVSVDASHEEHGQHK